MEEAEQQALDLILPQPTCSRQRTATPGGAPPLKLVVEQEEEEEEDEEEEKEEEEEGWLTNVTGPLCNMRP